MKTKPVTVYLDKVQTGNRKLNHFIKKHKPSEVSFNQLDQLAVNIYFFQKNNELPMDSTSYTVRLVFVDDYLPTLSLNLSGYKENNEVRIATKCLIATEERLRKDITSKSEHEQIIIKEDTKAAFNAFLSSGYLIPEGTNLLTNAKLAESTKKQLKSGLKIVSKKDKRQVNFLKNINQREEVFNYVV